MITSYEELAFIKEEAAGQPIYLKGGTFDLLHEGHEQMLSFLSGLGGISVVGISPDSRVNQRKGPARPVRRQTRRANDVDATGLVDFVFVVPEGILGLPRSINRLKPHAFVEHLSDTSYRAATKAVLKMAGIKYITADTPRICSTTEVIQHGAGLGRALLD